MKRQRITVLLVLALTFSACATKSGVNTSPPPPSDPIREIAFQSNRAKDALQALTDTKQALLRDGLITQAQSAALTNNLLVVVRILQRVNSAAAKYKDVSEGKAELLSLLSELQPALNTLTAIVPSLNGPAKDRIASILSVAAAAVAALVPLIKGVL